MASASLFCDYIDQSNAFRNGGDLRNSSKMLKLAIDLEEQKLKRAVNGDEAVRVTMVGLYRGLGQTAEFNDAIKYYNRGLELMAMGPVNDPQRREMMLLDGYDIVRGLALKYVNQDKLDLAEPLCRRTFVEGQMMYGNRPGYEEESSQSIRPLAFWCSKKDLISEAASLYEKVYNILVAARNSEIERPYCPSHTNLDSCVDRAEHDLIECWVNGKYQLDRADTFIRTALDKLESNRQLLDKVVIRKAILSSFLGAVLSLQGKPAEAEQTGYKALQMFEMYHNSFCNGYKGTAYLAVARSRVSQNKLDAETERLYKKSLEIMRQEQSQANVASVLYDLGLFYYRQHSPTQAIVCYREAKALYDRFATVTSNTPLAMLCQEQIKRIESGTIYHHSGDS
jgi:tetratricopeptide (TPR) repeat protein